ncbi:MAG TPA: hypothetical protein VGX21_06800 [Methylomirabilota bacterium]|nr:hypothetical protein [Methylomirabilota bacterium]
MAKRLARSWPVGVALAALAITAVAFAAQEPKGSVEFVVDGIVKRTWDQEQLRQLATTKWTAREGKEHPAIPLSTQLKEGGVSPEAIKELRFRGDGRTVTLKGDDLKAMERLVLHSGSKSFDRPWRLASTEPKKGGYRVGVRRIEVVSTG